MGLNLAYNLCSTEQLLALKKKVESEIKNWQRRIGEIESGVIDASGYPPVAEYRRRIEKIMQKIADVDEELSVRKRIYCHTCISKRVIGD